MLSRNQRGSVLVVVLVAAAALLTLGVTLSNVALSDQSQTIRQQKNNEAYYIARSGAEAVEAVLLKDPGSIQSYFGRTAEGELGGGRFEATVIDGGDGAVIIESTGYVGNRSEKLTLTLMPYYPGPHDPPPDEGGGLDVFLPIFDVAVFSSSDIKLNSGSPTIEGRVATNSVEAGGVLLNNAGGYRIVGDLYIGAGASPGIVVPNYRNKVSGDILELDQERHYPLPEFPDFPDNLPLKGILSTRNASSVIH